MGLFTLLTNPGNFEFYWQNQYAGSESPNSSINPREIPFGNDRANGGSSKQPYIVKNQLPFNENSKETPFYNDFILRGGILGPIAAAEDVSRLTRYFTDIDNPVGALFATKQNLLSKTGVKTEATRGSAYLGSAVNEGVYTPLSTLNQAGTGFLGNHVNKQGLDFIGGNIKTYQEVISQNQLNPNLPFSPNNNRLLSLQNSIAFNTSPGFSFAGVNKYRIYPDESILINYSGGPNSILGVGDTNIGFATTNLGTPLKTLTNPSQNNNLSSALFKTWDAKQLSDQPVNTNTSTEADFRKILDPTGNYQKFFLSKSPNYVTQNVEDRLGLGNPGRTTKDRSNYDAPQPPLDKVNASYIYKNAVSAGSNYYTDNNLKDILPFNIAILNNDLQPGGPFKKYMHFRAFIDSFSDNYNADWNAINYMGRAEKFYKYKGFDRTINMSFTVVAQSRPEITAMYDKLNFLASSLAPEYLDSTVSGYMAGNIAYLTLGGYAYEQPGIITQLTYDVPEESPWEIGINVDGVDTQDTEAGRKGVRQLPHIIRVTNFTFIPIHTFRPEKQTFKNDKLGTTSERLLEPGNQKCSCNGTKSSNIPIFQTTTDPKRRYTVVKYPSIPLGETDFYVYINQGDRFDILALNYYGDSSLWWIINRANPSQPSDSLYPRVGAQIRIPAPQRVADILSQYNELNGAI